MLPITAFGKSARVKGPRRYRPAHLRTQTGPPVVRWTVCAVGVTATYELCTCMDHRLADEMEVWGAGALSVAEE